MDTLAWYGWLGTARTFAFRSEVGTFTARKEQAGNKRGGWYWCAYRKRTGKLRRAYIGTSEELTLERLNTIAAVLAGQGEEEANLAAGEPGGSAPHLRGDVTSESFHPETLLPAGQPAASGSVAKRVNRPPVSLPVQNEVWMSSVLSSQSNHKVSCQCW